ncbi:HDOD domain-containing protein [Ramlibacter sp. MMS24-I3-19]|uniref:HDOD domain-containing protein n=1 Tax=Ramlibacter sp. MMS24-I3-19 TaxID=3416606 RepID=UPI003D005634
METPAPPLAAHLLARLEPCAVPVLLTSATTLARWALRPDEADASRLADVALRDPLLCLRVLQHVAAAFGSRLSTPVQTVTGALVLLGIEPFFRAFTGLPVLEERTAAHPGATAAALACVTRAHAAARIATAFAVHRQDDDVELLHQAALLHDFTELLLWCEAPREAAALKVLRQQEPQRGDEELQRSVLGGTLEEVAAEWLERWQLPPGLCATARSWDPEGPGGRSVRLALRIARHLDKGWGNALLAADLERAGGLLNLPPAGVASLVRHAL